MGPLGWPETVFIVLLALLLFGPKKLPELGRTLGKAITEFRRASAELRSTFDREMRNLEREAQAVKENKGSHYNDSYNYDHSAYDSTASYQPAEAPAESAVSAFANPTTEGASAAQGAPVAAAEPRPTLTVTPAPGTIPNGSLGGAVNGESHGSSEAASEAYKS